MTTPRGLTNVVCYMCIVYSTWCDDDVAGLLDYVNGLVHVHLGVSANDLHGLTARCGGGAVPTQDHIGQGAVHRLGREEDDNSSSGYCAE